MTEAKRLHERYTTIIDKDLRTRDICKRLEYTGSSYEGVKVMKTPSDADLEFDIQVILNGGDKLRAVEIPENPGFFKLRHKEFDTLRIQLQAYTDDPRLRENADQLPERTACTFYSELQKVINSNDELRNRINLRRHGPAIQMDVYKDLSKISKFYSVDMVPTFEVDGKRFVSKPLREGQDCNLAWRQSFSVEEKEKLRNADSDQGCRRQVLRVLKVMRNGFAELKPLESCHLKRALFKMMDQKPQRNSWAFDRLGERTVDVLRSIEMELATGSMPHYFVPAVNQISSWSPDTINNLKNRIHRLLEREERFTNLLQSYR